MKFGTFFARFRKMSVFKLEVAIESVSENRGHDRSRGSAKKQVLWHTNVLTVTAADGVHRPVDHGDLHPAAGLAHVALLGPTVGHGTVRFDRFQALGPIVTTANEQLALQLGHSESALGSGHGGHLAEQLRLLRLAQIFVPADAGAEHVRSGDRRRRRRHVQTQLDRQPRQVAVQRDQRDERVVGNLRAADQGPVAVLAGVFVAFADVSVVQNYTRSVWGFQALAVLLVAGTFEHQPFVVLHQIAVGFLARRQV